MALTYSIADWDDHFENNRSREVKNLAYVMLPNKHDGEGYNELIEGKNGPAMFGCWVAIVQVASKCDVRGKLVNNGKSLSAKSISLKTRLPEELIVATLEKLISIGWVTTSGDDGTTSREGAATSRNVATEQNRTEPNRTEEYKSGTLSKDNEPDRPVVMEFPTKGKNAKPFKLRQDKFDEYAEAFPAVDTAQELRNALQWLRDNPAKAKTERGMLAFLTRWLTRVQNSGGSRNGREQNGGGYRHAAEAREAANASAFDHVRSLIANNAGST